VHKARRIVAGAGALMFAAALTLVSLRIGPWAKTHPENVLHWIIGLTLGAIICFAFWVLTTDEGLRHRKRSKSPLEIIFDPTNPARRFWSMESYFDDYHKLTGTYWEHRVEIKNAAPLTLRNVAVTVEHIGQLPAKPERAHFTRSKTDSCDINPGCSELVLVNRWPVPKQQVGMPSAESAWVYGPIKVIASADNTMPAEKTYDFNYETDQMLFERKETVKREYHFGKDARERFERTMTALFRAPKKQLPKKSVSEKKEGVK